MSDRVFRDGTLYVVVRQGLPTDYVEIGVGETVDQATALLGPTEIQSQWRGSTRAALSWAHGAGAITSEDLDEVESYECAGDACCAAVLVEGSMCATCHSEAEKPARTRAEIEAWARDYNWEDTQPTIEDPEFAADEIIGQLDDWAEEDLGILRLELIESATRENERRSSACDS